MVTRSMRTSRRGGFRAGVTQVRAAAAAAAAAAHTSRRVLRAPPQLKSIFCTANAAAADVALNESIKTQELFVQKNGLR